MFFRAAASSSSLRCHLIIIKSIILPSPPPRWVVRRLLLQIIKIILQYIIMMMVCGVFCYLLLNNNNNKKSFFDTTTDYLTGKGIIFYIFLPVCWQLMFQRAGVHFPPNVAIAFAKTLHFHTSSFIHFNTPPAPFSRHFFFLFWEWAETQMHFTQLCQWFPRLCWIGVGGQLGFNKFVHFGPF